MTAWMAAGGQALGVAIAHQAQNQKADRCNKVLMLNDDYTPMEFVV